MNKAELQDEIRTYGLSIDGTVEDLRSRLVAVVRANLPKTPLTPSGGAESLLSQTGRGIHSQGPEFEASVIREMLGLHHEVDSRTLISRLRETLVTKTDEHLTTRDQSQQETTRPQRLNYESHPIWINTDPRLSTGFEFSTQPQQNDQLNLQRKITDICGLIRKWNLRFDGERDPISFIERLTELIDAYEVTPDDVLKALPELFKDHALLWYRMNKESWKSFVEFKQDFIRQFWPAGYDIKLDDEIRKRTQGPGETFKNYSLAVGTLIRRRGGYTEREKIERIYGNMRPEYKGYVRRGDFVDMQGLQRLAEEYETLVRDSKTYQPPPDVSHSLVPETAYRYKRNRESRHDAAPVDDFIKTDDTNRETTAQTTNPFERIQARNQKGLDFDQAKQRSTFTRINKPYEIPPNNQRSSDQMAHPPRAPRVCWNCDIPGHFARDCRKPRMLKCFHCKKPGIRTTDCCGNQGNERWTLTNREAQSPDLQSVRPPLRK